MSHLWSSPVRIMVVEDEAIVAMDLEQQLRAAGYGVAALFDTGEEAVQRVQEVQPDAILMDIRLKGQIDGIQAAEQIRTLVDVPVIYLTAHSDEETFRRARITDPMAYVLKPFDRRGLQAAIELGLYRHRTDRKLRQMEQWLGSTLRSIGDALVTTDISGRVTYLNEEASRLTGWTAEEAIGLEFEEVVPLIDGGGQPIESPVRQVLREGVIVGLAEGTRVLRRDGRQIAVQDSAAPIRDAAKRITGVVIVVREAADRERLRTQLSETEAQLRQSQKLETIGQLAGGIAHDFNNLITVIVGYSEILQRVVPRSADVSGPLDNILQAGRRAAELTQRLLAFSRKQIVKIESMSLGEVVAGMMGMMERVISEDIELQVTRGNGDDRITGDRGQIEQIALNLATNARDAMPHGGRLTLATRGITLTAGSAELDEGLLPGRYVVFEVTDTGLGMDAGTKARIFEPFFTTKDVGKGTGLGLSMVYGIVRDHGGMIRVSSQPGRGTTFRVYLPWATGTDAVAPADEVATEMSAGSETILIVEDNAPLRSLIERILDRASYATISCGDGDTALERARSTVKIDAVLLDVVLPRVPGPELAARLKALRPEAKVLMMSGYGEEAVARVPYTQAHFIRKPFSGHELCARLRQVLDAPEIHA